MALRSKIRVGVLRGGPSHEHHQSIKTGAHVLKNLPDHYTPIDIFVDKAGIWYVQGVAEPLPKALKKIDVVLNAMHGTYGEDGTLQRLLDTVGMPYTGSGHLASVFAMHKGHTKNLLKKHGIKTPYHKLLKKDDALLKNLRELWGIVPNPSAVKPVALGSSVGLSVVKSFPELAPALEKAFAFSPTILIEEYITGREASCGVIGSFRDQEIYPLFPAEFAGSEGKTVHPGRFSALEKHTMQTVARAVHKELGLRHYSQSDFIVSPKRGVYFLEVNSLPSLAQGGAFTEALSAIGLSLPLFLDHVLTLALKGK